MLRNPRSARNTSSGPAQIAISVKHLFKAGQCRALALVRPSSRSEWPDRYLVPASMAMSTPRSWGGKNSGVAQVLSITTAMSRGRHSAAMAGMSCISKLCDPGASTSTARVLGRKSSAMPAPTLGS